MNKPDPMYRDDGEFKTIREGKAAKEYSAWYHMRHRCYLADRSKRYKGYEDCEVAEEFHSFQRFATWAIGQVGINDGFQLDKDLLVKGNRIYAPDTCLFLPGEINRILIRNKDKRTDMPVGVMYRPEHVSGKPYVACVNKNSKSVALGYFDSIEKAFLSYKVAKEEILKAVAEKYKSVIDPRAYAALVAYQIEITD
jgi:hypothetical protein